jgi:hypothetical protein
LDGWTGEELRLWPDELLDLLAELFSAVEAHGRWPELTSFSEVVLLAKPGGDPANPLDRRPIVLMSVLYRVWARYRRREFDGWRAQWDTAVAAAWLGADGQAWEFGWDTACAHAGSGAGVAGVAVDFSKCYDGCRLALVSRALARAGVPPAISRPLLAAYGFTRRLRVGDAWGGDCTPTSGIPAGCPLAVSVLAVLTAPWGMRSHRLRRALGAGAFGVAWAPGMAVEPPGPPATGPRRGEGAGDGQAEVLAGGERRYVDDLLFWVVGERRLLRRAAASAWAIALAFARALQWELSEGKSHAFAWPGGLAERIQADLPMVRVKGSFRDLGVVQVLGGRRQVAVADLRLFAAGVRAERVGRLPVPRRVKVQFVESQVVPAACYGALAACPGVEAIRKLRVQAAGAIYLGGGAGNQTLRLLLASPACRADPAAPFAIEPLWALARGVAEGRCTADGILKVQSHGQGGLVAALRCATAALELEWDLLEWTPRPGSPPSCHFFLDPCPPGAAFAARAWLRDRWRRVQLARVAQRPGFAGLEAGLDWELLRVALATARSPTRLGALWSILVGDVVTQDRASHFPQPDLGRDPLCPHCEAERETPEHRLWVRDAWADLRDREAEAAGWASASALAEAAPRSPAARPCGPPILF